MDNPAKNTTWQDSWNGVLCPSCGQRNPVDAYRVSHVERFCRFCGARLRPIEETPLEEGASVLEAFMKIKEIEAMQEQSNLKFETAKAMVSMLDDACKKVKALGMDADEIPTWRDEILELVTGE